MAGCAGKSLSIWHGEEGRKLAAVEAGQEVMVVAQVWSLGTGPQWSNSSI